jgi:hypothetical protein
MFVHLVIRVVLLATRQICVKLAKIQTLSNQPQWDVIAKQAIILTITICASFVIQIVNHALVLIFALLVKIQTHCLLILQVVFVIMGTFITVLTIVMIAILTAKLVLKKTFA